MLRLVPVSPLGIPGCNLELEISLGQNVKLLSGTTADVVQFCLAHELVSVFQVDSDEIHRRWKSL